MRQLLTIAVLGIAITACTSAAPSAEARIVSIPTAPMVESACRLRLNSGTLVVDEEFGLAVLSGEDRTVVVWPHGWAAMDQDGTRILLNDHGDPVARVGDTIAFGGAEGPGGRIHACGEIERVP
jgi:hypothetical protein